MSPPIAVIMPGTRVSVINRMSDPVGVVRQVGMCAGPVLTYEIEFSDGSTIEVGDNEVTIADRAAQAWTLSPAE